MKKQLKNIYWGILLIAAAVLIILKSFDVSLGIIASIPVLDLVIAAFVVSVMISSAANRDFALIPFELAVIFMVFENEIAEWTGKGTNGKIINNWLLIGCAALISAGISLLFKNGKKLKKGSHKFTSYTKYIDCTSFDYHMEKIKMGDCTICFQNTDSYKGDGVLEVECSMGDMKVYVPKEWNLISNIDNSMGTVDISPYFNKDGLKLTVNGSCKMGNLEIISQ